MAGRGVVAREDRLPAIVRRFTGEYWRVEIRLQPTSSGAPDIEIAIASRLHTEKHGDEQPYEQEWQGGSLRARKGRRQRDAHRDDRPIGRVVEPRSPDRRAIDLAPVEMRDSAHFGGIECVSGLCFVGNHNRHDGDSGCPNNISANDRRRKTSIHLDEEPAVVICDPSPAFQLTPQDDQLMSENRILRLKPALRLEWRGQHGQNKPNQRDYRANLADSVT